MAGVATPAYFVLSNGTENPSVFMPETPSAGFTFAAQNGLFKITVRVENTTPLPINGLRLHLDLSPYLATDPSPRLYNASSPADSPGVYMDHPHPVALGGSVSLNLWFYTKTRTFPNPFSPVLAVASTK